MILVVVTVHRWCFGFCGGVMVGGDRAVIAGAAGAGSQGQACHDRSLQQESRDEAEERLRAVAREQIREVARELHGRGMLPSMIRQIRRRSAPGHAPPKQPTARRSCKSGSDSRSSEQLDRTDLQRVALHVARDVHAKMILFIRSLQRFSDLGVA